MVENKYTNFFGFSMYMFTTIIIFYQDYHKTPSLFGCNAEEFYSPHQSETKNSQMQSAASKKHNSKTKIIGGATQNLNSPNAARIALIEDYSKARCAGALQNALYLITAAHCVYQIDPAQLIVTVGYRTLDLKQNRSVVSFDTHPEWIPNTSLHDIAVLRMNTSLYLSVEEVVPVELGQPLLPNGSVSVPWITGWGMSKSFGSNAPPAFRSWPYQVPAPLVDVNTCKQAYKNIGKEVHTNQMCAGGILGQGPCTGDGGAPLMAFIKWNNGLSKLLVLGILSSFEGCATGVPDIYTNLDKYKSWVELVAG